MKSHRNDLKKDARLYWRLLGFIRAYFHWVIAAFIFNGLYSAIDAGFIYSLKPILDKGFNERDPFMIHWLPWLLIAALFFRGLTSVVANYSMSYASRSVIMTFRRAIFSHLLKLPANYYDRHSSGHILSIILFNVSQISSASANALTTVAQSGFYIIGLLVVMFTISFKLSLLFLIVVPVVALTMRYSSRRVRQLSHGVQRLMGSVSSTAEEVVEGYKVVRSFGGQAYEKNKFKRLTKQHLGRELNNVFVNAISVSSIQLVAGIALALIVYLALSHHINLTSGSFVALVTAVLAILKPLKNMTQVSNTIQRGLAGAESVFSLLDEPVENDQGQKQVERIRGSICYRGVSFTYPQADKPVLNAIDLDVAPGKMIALVGKSGGGKTTMVNLLPRFYDTFSGQILIDGVDSREYTLESLRQQFSLVSQDTVLFNDSIAHNIAYGRFEMASEEEIIAAAKAAHAWEFIKELPQGLATTVGENGVLLSGGQRQRLAIARAILKNAPILILDEATASLDTESERYIQEALQTLMAGRTTLVIAHRLSTVESADCIVVVDQGSLIERGTHQQLLAADGYYAQLYNTQFKSHDA